MSFLRTPAGHALASLALAAVGVGVLAAYMPRRAPLAAPVALVCVAAALLALGALRAGRGGIAANVARPTLVAAGLAAALLELVFAYDGARGAPLAVITALLALVALDLPLLLGSSVAQAAQE